MSHMRQEFCADAPSKAPLRPEGVGGNEAKIPKKKRYIHGVNVQWKHDYDQTVYDR